MKLAVYAGIFGAALALGSCAPKTEEIEIVIDENIQQHTLQSVLYHQTAGEYKALCYQTYNLAKWQLDNKLANHAFPYEKAPAIVMDLDETVVDNSYFNAQLIKDDSEFSQDKWNDWSAKQSAGKVPGAVEFINYASSKGVKVIFISNRRVGELENTMANLAKIGINDLDTNRVFLRVDEGSKMARRAEVMKDHEILMLFGDNLADFTELFDKKSIADRNQLVDSLHTEFGDRFIVLPNIIYGEWEGALTNYERGLEHHAKDSIRKSLLKGY